MMNSTCNGQDSPHASPRYIPLSYSPADSQSSALRLVLALNPDWGHGDSKIEFVRFTDGITNTLLKIINRKPGLTEEQIDDEAVLMRAYGNHTEIIIDRERESRSHALLARRGLAPALLARFKNGLLYRFIQGQVATPNDLIQAPVWRGVARRLAEWHAVLPIGDVDETSSAQQNGNAQSLDNPESETKTEQEIGGMAIIESKHDGPNMWRVLQKWILALPTTTEKERSRRIDLQRELIRTAAEMDDGKGIGQEGLIFAHCDLLSANVIIQPKTSKTNGSAEDGSETVHFIDYEYATPSPAAFDIANHFAEWAGYDCDYGRVPTQSVRREFLAEYVKSYTHHLGGDFDEAAQNKIADDLFNDIDRFRGIPGFYWYSEPLTSETSSFANEKLQQGCMGFNSSHNLTH
ncbi:hypothetical protein FQN54_002001 [Arachnomyces sp. PD_36]|nr:hypothetical protein FQN54_002001 [Arachnomyces sp. PD_36]